MTETNKIFTGLEDLDKILSGGIDPKIFTTCGIPENRFGRNLLHTGTRGLLIREMSDEDINRKIKNMIKNHAKRTKSSMR